MWTPVEKNGGPTYAALCLIPAESLGQFPQLYEIPEQSSFDSRHEVVTTSYTRILL